MNVMGRTARRDIAWPALAIAMAALACVAAYAPGLSGPFLFDDFDAIHPLAQMQAQGLDWFTLLDAAPAHIRARAFSNLSFLLNNALATPAPSSVAYKATNLGIHIVCGLAVAGLGRLLAARWGAQTRRAWWVAAIAGSVFLLHPLLVSTVLYPVQRMAQLATLFTLVSTMAYCRWRATLGMPGWRAGAWLGATLAAMAMSFASKQSGALTPLLILAVEVTAFRWPGKDDPARTRFETGFGLACAGPIVLGAVTLAVRWKEYASGYEVRDFTLAERLLTELHVVAGYVAQALFPRVHAMGMYNDDLAVVKSLDVHTLLLALAFLAAAGAAVALRRRTPALAFAILWFFASHVLESTVIPLELVFEHRNYLALAGPAIAFAVYAGSPRWRAAGTCIAVLACVGLALLTWQRSREWSDYRTWIVSEARNHPASLRAGTDLMVYHLRHGDIPSAVSQRETLAATLPTQAQPVLLKLGFACRGPLPVALFAPADLQMLASAPLGKDAFHAYVGLRELVEARAGCDVDWTAFEQAADAVLRNPAVRRHRRAHVAWLRLRADALARPERWSEVRGVLETLFALDASDPRDWLLMLEAQIETGDLPGYLHSRARAEGLLRGQPESLGRQLLELDRRAEEELEGGKTP